MSTTADAMMDENGESAILKADHEAQQDQDRKDRKQNQNGQRDIEHTGQVVVHAADERILSYRPPIHRLGGTTA
ncbi:MAG TPA: hypothetical protein VGC28_10425 [Sphingomonas sp.]